MGAKRHALNILEKQMLKEIDYFRGLGAYWGIILK
jgi:hypothetical protein